MEEAELAELLDPGTSRARAETFQLLRPLTTRMLQLQQARATPSELAAALQALQAAVQSADQRGLKACWDYLMFPLLLLLESAALVRRTTSTGAPGSSSRQGLGGDGRQTAPQQLPAASDRVAEAVVACTQSVLERVSLQEDQRLSVLQKLVPMLQLPRGAAPEEVRLRSFTCAAILLQPPTAAAAATGPGSSTLASEPLAPLVGAVIHSCLEAAAAELEAGQLGSKGVRASALQALHALVVSVGCGEALAFFLPGIASGLSKQLLASAGARSAAAPTGAAAGAAATVAALQALVATVQLTLGDAVTRPLIDSDGHAGPMQQLRSLALGAQAPAPDPLAVLQQLAASMTLAEPSSSGGKGAAASPGSSGAAPPLPQPQPVRGRLRMDITPDWVRASAARVETVLAMVLPALATHPRPSVRVELAEGVASLLDSCTLALEQCRQPLLEIMLSLAQDEWPQVSSAAVQWLSAAGPGTLRTLASASTAAGAAGGSSNAAVGHDAMQSGRIAGQGGVASPAAQALGALLTNLCQGLAASVKAGEDRGALHAKRLTTALLYAGPSQVSSVLLQRPAGLSHLMDGLLQCFAFDSTGAALLLHARAAPGSYGEPMALPAPAGAAQEPAAGATAAAAAAAAAAAQVSASIASAGPSTARPTASTSSSAPQTTVSLAASGRPFGAAAVLLPRMPLGLAHLGSVRAYTATANVARALGRLARTADLASTSATTSTAGGSNMRRIMDMVLSRLQQALHQQRQQQRLHTLADGSWQCEAAAAAAVAAEVMFGASAAWQPPTPGTPQASVTPSSDIQSKTVASTAVEDTDQPPSKKQRSEMVGSLAAVQARWPVPAVGEADAEFESLLGMLLEGVTQEALWGVATTQPEGEGAQAISAQVLGENALMLRVLIDTCGAAARAAGRRLSGRLLRTILLPLLEHLSSPCAPVADAADTALCSICMHCGYAPATVTAPDARDAGGAASTSSSAGAAHSTGARGGLAALVAANADYVVDGVCKQLRSLGRHPRAPQLLAALLRKAGVGQELVPLLAEPAQAAIKGLSILSRRQQPSQILPFLYALLEIASGVSQEAQLVQLLVQQRLLAVSQRAAAQEAARQQAEAEEERAAASATAAVHEGDADEARSYFLRRAEKKQRVQERPSGVTMEGVEEAAGDGDDVDMEALAEGRKLQLSDEEVEELEVLYRRAYSAALLANAAADAAGPLMYSDDLKVAVLSLDVSSAALRALSRSTSALECEQRIFDELARRPADGAMRPARPEPPKLLPAVHLLWGPLMAMLRGAARAPLLEKGLGLLAEVTVLGGGRFMAQRFQKEAWPLLARLLQGEVVAGGGGRRGRGMGQVRSSKELLGLEGSGGAAAGSSSVGAGDDGDVLAPASVERIKAAALHCLERVASHEDASRAAQAIVWPVGVAVAPFLADTQPLPLREAAAKLLVALAAMDADAVWLLLTDLARNCPEARLQLQCPEPGKLPSLQQLLPPMAQHSAGASPCGSGSSSVAGKAHAWSTADVAVACGRRAQVLLQQVAVQVVQWHEYAHPTSTISNDS